MRSTPELRRARVSTQATTMAPTIRTGTRIATNHSVLSTAVPIRGSLVNRNFQFAKLFQRGGFDRSNAVKE